MLSEHDEPIRFEAEVSSSVATFGLAHATHYGGHGGNELGLWRGLPGESSVWVIAQGDSQRDSRTRRARQALGGSHPPARSGTKIHHAVRSATGADAGSVDR